MQIKNSWKIIAAILGLVICSHLANALPVENNEAQREFSVAYITGVTPEDLDHAIKAVEVAFAAYENRLMNNNLLQYSQTPQDRQITTLLIKDFGAILNTAPTVSKEQLIQDLEDPSQEVLQLLVLQALEDQPDNEALQDFRGDVATRVVMMWGVKCARAAAQLTPEAIEFLSDDYIQEFEEIILKQIFGAKEIKRSSK